MRQFVAVLCFLTCEIAGENVQEKNTTFSEEIETTTAIEITTRIPATTAATTTTAGCRAHGQHRREWLGKRGG